MKKTSFDDAGNVPFIHYVELVPGDLVGFVTGEKVYGKHGPIIQRKHISLGCVISAESSSFPNEHEKKKCRTVSIMWAGGVGSKGEIRGYQTYPFYPIPRMGQLKNGVCLNYRTVYPLIIGGKTIRLPTSLELMELTY